MLHTTVSDNPTKAGFLFLPEKGDFFKMLGTMNILKEF